MQIEPHDGYMDASKITFYSNSILRQSIRCANFPEAVRISKIDKTCSNFSYFLQLNNYYLSLCPCLHVFSGMNKTKIANKFLVFYGFGLIRVNRVSNDIDKILLMILTFFPKSNCSNLDIKPSSFIPVSS